MTLIAASLGFAVVQLDVSVVNVAVKAIGASVGGGVSDLQWIVSSYTIAFAALILTAGALGDRIGARRLFVIGFVVFTLASIAAGAAPSLPVLVAARAVQGAGAAMIVPTSLSLLNHSHPEPRARARAVGLYLAVASLALSGGPLVGGLLIAAISWRAIFFINVPIATVGLFLTIRYASETTRSTSEGIDWPGQATAITALVALVGAMIEGGRHGFTSLPVIVGFALGAVALGSFVVIEARSPHPMLPLQLFAVRTFAASNAIGLMINTSFYGLLFVWSLLFQREQGYSPVQTGLLLLPATVGVTASNLSASRVAARVGSRLTIAGGAGLIIAATIALLFVEASTPFAAMILQVGAIGFGLGLCVPVVTSETLGSVDRRRSGVAAGTLNTMRQTGSAIGVALFGSLIATSFFAGFHASLIIVAGLMVAVIALSTLLSQLDPAGR